MMPHSWFRAEVVHMVNALRRARASILTITLVHAITVAIGMVMVHAGNPYALQYRDRLVARARASDPVSRAYLQGDRLRAAWMEAARTQWACLAAGLTGPTVIGPVALTAYRGWIGGIVSVDGDHLSRLREPAEAAYYLSVIVLQLIPYSMVVGAGLNIGLAYFRPRSDYPGEKWMGYPKEAISDFFRIFLATAPLVLAANLWEFLSPLRG